MVVWRICSQTGIEEAFSGKGPQRNGQRWNPPGAAVVYTADSLALAAIEFFVNMDEQGPPDGLCAISARIPESTRVITVDAGALPPDWRRCTAPESLQEIGAAWLAGGESAVLAAPSAVIPEERIYLLNPAHPEFGAIAIGLPRPFQFDPRMWK
jgi:RES domain-containing protein